MSKKSLLELKSLLQAEKADALAAVRSSKLSAERTKAMDYYNGNMTADMPAEDGRSRAVSSDVSDTIEGLMPSMMEIFAGSDEVVRFDPRGPNDVQAAEQEGDYCNHVFMQQNPGFLVLYSFIKDALLSKVGIVKVWWQEDEEEHKETYLDQSDQAFMMLVMDPEIEIVAHSMRPAPPDMAIKDVPGTGGLPQLAPPDASPPQAEGGGAQQPAGPQAQPPGAPGQLSGAPTGYPGAPGLPVPAAQQAPAPGSAMLHDITVVTVKKTAKAVVEGVPPEEFGISKHARTLKDCGYCYHEVIKRQEDLIAEGFDETQVKTIPTYTMLTNPEELARDTVDEHLSGGGDEGMNEPNRQVKVTEHYIRMDYEGNGKPCLYRVTAGGDQGEVLDRDGEPDIHEIDMIPFAAMTPVIVSHRFFGRSIADLVMDIQRIKTAILRSILDNTYLANNPRVVVSEQDATSDTLDDLLISRPGGIVRTKTGGGVNWQEVPNIAAAAFPVMEYLDQTREWRTGVNRQSQGLDAQALQNQSATAAMQVYNASQAKMKLIARIFAETGVRDLFSLLHATIRKNGTQAATVRLRTQWVPVNPRDWKERNEMTINVGLGAGGKAEQMLQLMAVINLQKDAIAGGFSNLVTVQNLYASGVEFAKLAGRKDYDQFFTDPKTQPAPQAPPDPKMMQIQGQLELQQAKQQTDAAHQTAKAQSDMAIQQQKFELEMRQTLFQAHTDNQQRAQEMHQSNQEHQMSMAQMAAKIQQSQTPSAAVEVKHNTQDIAGPMADVVAQLGQHLAAHTQAQTQAIVGALQHASAPKRIIRDKAGKAMGVETVPLQ